MLLILFNPLIGPLSDATTPGQSGLGSNGNEGVLRIPQSSSIAGTSPSDCLVSYPGHSLEGGVLLLCFDLRPGPKKCYSKVMHRKEVTHSNGQ